MIPKECLINKLDELGLHCTNPGQLIGLFKGRVRGVDRVATVNIAHDLIDELTVNRTLVLIGCDSEEIEAFVTQTRAIRM
jgi:hypothetical protein